MGISKKMIAMIMAAWMILASPMEALAAEAVVVSEMTAETTEATPALETTPEATPEASPNASPEATPAVETIPEATPEASPKASPEATPAVETTPEATPEASPEATPVVETTPEATPEASPNASPEATPVVETTPEVTPEVSPKVSPEVTPTAEATPEATPGASPTASSESQRLANMTPEERLAELERIEKELGLPMVSDAYVEVDYEPELPGKNLNTAGVIGNERAVTIPDSYDARETGRVSAVKDQNPFGSCWSFSAVACAEAAYMSLYGKEANLSESHLVEFFYTADDMLLGPDGGLEADGTVPVGDTELQRGGNSYFTTWGLATWAGVADEATDASLVYPGDVSSSEYQNYSLQIDSSLAYQDALHLENAYWLSTEDPDSVKKAIMDYGTVGISYYHDNSYSSDIYSAYESDFTGPAVYYNPTYTYTNHAVSLVGWDDNFDKNNFKYTYSNYGSDTSLPENDGAWLMKNSWGTSAGDEGYYWISYEDASLQSRAVFAFDFAGADNYDHNYQYDGATGLEYYYTGTTTTAAAVYTANGDQYLEAVGVGFAAADTAYTVKVYTDLTDVSNPESGTLEATKTGQTSYEGFYTIELGSQVMVEEGETFAVVVEAVKDTGACLFIDATYENGGWISFVAEVGKGETFYKSGTSWYDAANSSAPFTFRIKAYSSDVNPKEEVKQDLLNSMIQNFGDATYTGEEICPKPMVIYNGVSLKEGEDYSITYSDNQNVGTATVTFTGMGKYAGTVMRTFRILPKSLSKDMVADMNASGQVEAIYTGTEYEALQLECEKQGSLTEGKDYTLTYNKTPLEAGSYTATMKGMGNFSGTLKVTVKILADELTEDMVTLGFDSGEYTGSNIKPSVMVQAKEAQAAAANYSVKYASNKNAGTATVTITGKKSLKGKVVKTFTITPKPLEEKSILVTVASAKYSGKALEPKVTVKDGTKTLSAGKDYRLDYSNNIDATDENPDSDAGDPIYGLVTLTGMGNYQGAIKKNFTIAPNTVKSGAIKVELRASAEDTGILVKVNNQVIAEENYTLTVKEAGTDIEVQEPELQVDKKYDVEVTLVKNYRGTALLKGQTCKIAAESLTVTIQNPEKCIYTGKAVKPKVVVTCGDKVISSKNYSISYSNNINANTAEGSEAAKLTITGKGSVSGTQTLEYTIYPKSLDAAFAEKDSIITSVKDQTYTGGAITPKITVKGLKEGEKKDFIVTYENNMDVCYKDGAVDKAARVTVTLSDNYTISDTTKLTTTFRINPAKISSVKVSKQFYKGEGVLVTPEPAVLAGKVVVPKEAYEVQYTGNDKVNSKVAVVVTAKAEGNFVGEKKATFSISKEALSKLEIVKIEDMTYDGSAKQPELVLLKDGVAIDASHYTLTYSKNINAGTASVTATAVAGSIYSGKVTVKFKILPADLSSILEEKTGVLPAKTYNGKAQTFTKAEREAAFVEATTGNKIPAGSYKVTYENNKNAGVATMILKGNKNYTGTAIKEFKIAPKSIAGINVDYEEVLAYDKGNPVLPVINKVTDGKLKLKEGIDYTVSLDSSKYTKRGTVYMSITGIGNYAGTMQKSYKIQ